MALSAAQTDPSVEDTLNELSRLTAGDWIVAGSIVIASVMIGLLVRRLTTRALTNRSGPLVANLAGRLGLAVAVALGLVYALNQVGVSMGPLLGLLGLLGLALALAFQDVLSNFIAGVMLSVRRPFKIGDQVRTAGYEGTVEDVDLRTVTLRTFDGVRVFIPNATVWDEPIENSTTLGGRRTTMDLGVSYDSDLDSTRQLILNVLESSDGVLSDPAPEARVHEFGDSSINFAVQFWHDPHMASEWKTRDELARRLKREFESAGIEIPFPQVVVREAQ